MAHRFIYISTGTSRGIPGTCKLCFCSLWMPQENELSSHHDNYKYNSPWLNDFDKQITRAHIQIDIRIAVPPTTRQSIRTLPGDPKGFLVCLLRHPLSRSANDHRTRPVFRVNVIQNFLRPTNVQWVGVQAAELTVGLRHNFLSWPSFAASLPAEFGIGPRCPFLPVPIEL